VIHDPGQEYWDRYNSSLEAKLQEKQAEQRWGITWRIGFAAAMAVVLFIFVRVNLSDNSQQPKLSADKQLAVVQELLKLYGPVDGTYENTSSELVELLSQKYLTAALPQDVLVPWFEVEDEPSG
jgi:predicted small secreted protein